MLFVRLGIRCWVQYSQQYEWDEWNQGDTLDYVLTEAQKRKTIYCTCFSPKLKFKSNYILVWVEPLCWNKPKETREAPFIRQVASWLCVVKDFFSAHSEWGFPRLEAMGWCVLLRGLSTVDWALGWLVGSNASAAVNPAPVTDRHACGQSCIPEPNTARSGTPPSPLFNPHHNKFTPS